MIRGLLIESGTQASLNRVRRRMRQIGIMGRQFKRKRNTTHSHHRLGCAPNLLQQDFTVVAPNQSWVGDITYLRAGNTWAHLSTVIDLFSRKVIGWAVGQRIQTQLVREAFEMAMLRRGNPKGGSSIRTEAVHRLSVSFVCN
jgi:putative transposase